MRQPGVHMLLRVVLVCSLLGAVALVGACGSGAESEGGGGAGEAGTEDGAASVQEQASSKESGEESGSDTVFVYMDEYLIDMPPTVPAGDVIFEVRNAGFEEHNFEILRNDSLLWSFDNPLNPAQSRTLHATLEPGKYDILCTVSGHEGRGMQEVLTVTDG